MRQVRSRRLKQAALAMRRVVAWVGMLALLSYALTAGPIMLRMAVAHAGPQADAAAVAPCPLHAGHAQHQHDQSPLTDHARCLFCQGSVGPALLTAPAMLLAPSFEAAPFAIVWSASLAIAHLDAGYASRAPPTLT